MTGIANVNSEFKIEKGAQFWVYISPQNNTSEVIKGWSVTISQGNWSGTINSENPTQQLQTPNLSGLFDIKITKTDYSTNPPRQIPIPAIPPSRNQIGCNSNCASMIGIVANPKIKYGSPNSKFWTTWDAVCSR